MSIICPERRIKNKELKIIEISLVLIGNKAQLIIIQHCFKNINKYITILNTSKSIPFYETIVYTN